MSLNKIFAQQFEIADQLNTTHHKISFSETLNANYTSVDTKVRDYGAKYNSSNELAEQILKDFTLKKERIRALYTWICLNIHYDMDALTNKQTEISFSYTSKADFNSKIEAVNSNIITTTLQSKKAICEGYALTFKRVSEYLGIPCVLIGGFTKGKASDINNPTLTENHAWNAVKIDKKWYLIDTTWGAGYFNGNRWVSQFDDFYFFTDPKQFALTHYPTEKEWLLREDNLTKKQFYNTPIYKKSFFLNKMKLISPNFGLLKVATGDHISFLINKIPENTHLFYAYEGDKYSKKVELNCNNSQCNFAIPFKKNRDSVLYLFLNQQPILEFFVENKR